MCAKVVVSSAAFTSAAFLAGVFRKPELMRWFVRNGVPLAKAPGSMRGRKIDLCKPWPQPGKEWFTLMMGFDLSAPRQYVTKAAAILPQNCTGNKGGGVGCKGQSALYCPFSCPAEKTDPLHDAGFVKPWLGTVPDTPALSESP